MRITNRMLKNSGACSFQRLKFRSLWPFGVEVTFENCLKAAEAGLDLSWAANNLFTGDVLAEYIADLKRMSKEYYGYYRGIRFGIGDNKCVDSALEAQAFFNAAKRMDEAGIQPAITFSSYKNVCRRFGKKE